MVEENKLCFCSQIQEYRPAWFVIMGTVFCFLKTKNKKIVQKFVWFSFSENCFQKTQL